MPLKALCETVILHCSHNKHSWFPWVRSVQGIEVAVGNKTDFLPLIASKLICVFHILFAWETISQCFKVTKFNPEREIIFQKNKSINV